MDALLQFWIFFINRCTVILLIMRFGSTNQCLESTKTVHYVHACPQSAEKWTEAAKRLNCQSVSTNCTTFVYHCVLDHYRTKMIEVCAPKKIILGFLCVEYNEYGNVIQRNKNAKCKACPKIYNSTILYQYPECFKINTKMNTTSAIKGHLRQDTYTTNKTRTNELFNITTTAATTSELQYSINNDNKNGHTDPTNVNTNRKTVSNRDWSAFITCIFSVGLATIFILFVVTLAIHLIVRLLQRKTMTPYQLVSIRGV